MEGYPHSIYLSASWGGDGQALVLLVTKELAQRDFTLIGDHEITET